ncbi:hypothetical protein GCM10022280_09450 [Sphingomonas swuensis]|uniref:Uncharacterized protein n=1 Tax=Sphingomonas swuensis TaxID=977800 RepID=A0ABP7SLH2_9SPHN
MAYFAFTDITRNGPRAEYLQWVESGRIVVTYSRPRESFAVDARQKTIASTAIGAVAGLATSAAQFVTVGVPFMFSILWGCSTITAFDSTHTLFGSDNYDHAFR